MGTAVAVKISNALPAIFQQVGGEAFDEFSKGVTAGFPVISYRGKVWRIKQGGEEQLYLDENGEARQSIELVLVRSNPKLAKIFYEGAYAEGDTSAPRCWSADGERPDAGVQNPISKACAACPKNAWGSKITPAGKKTRACADHRRMAVAFRHDVEAAALNSSVEVPMYLLRTPPASLNPLREYIEDVLKPKGVPPYAVFTKIGFDPAASHPQLTFKGVQFLNNEQGIVVVALRESEDTKRILAEAQEYSAAGTTDDAGTEGNTSDAAASAAEAVTPTKSAAAAPAASPKKTAAPRPVEQEEANSGEAETTDDIAPPAPVTAAVEIAPAVTAAAAPAKPKPAAKPKAPKPAAATPAPAGDGQSFDDMLNSLLDT
jgi:hypothetical protein